MESTELAPIAAEPDWNAIQERYLQGEELAVIAEDTGATVNAIRCRAYRNRWKQQQLRLLEKDKAAVEQEIRGNLLVSILRETRVFQREDIALDPITRDMLSKCRERLITSASRLLGWEERDALSGVKRANCIDV